MSKSEAAQLVLQAGAMGAGGELFILKMGDPVRIEELARRLIELAGLRPGEDIQIVYTGLRPGERMEERLWEKDEEPVETGHGKILKAGTATARVDGILSAIHALAQQHQPGSEGLARQLILLARDDMRGTACNIACLTAR
jgi:FlaA1/EpsC-like NDP-sugar epimerase